ncbi:hypothetical protein Dxin01_03821 [Deinococcus xinjiangensis]|uniref:Uncharacterized protein n=1 Tax=Deinococcus xinjiangensis TaxID=457454 RepID=A0ABP9VKY4_9DEIO
MPESLFQIVPDYFVAVVDRKESSIMSEKYTIGVVFFLADCQYFPATRRMPEFDDPV